VAKRKHSVIGTCVFCGSYGPLTQEDALPVWLMSLIPAAGFTWGKTPAVWKANLRRANLGYRLKVQALCEDCNGIKWLGSIEKQAKPKLMAWMKGIYSPMTIDDQRLLAFWAVKTAMTVLVAQSRVQRVIPMAQYRELHAARTHPPSGFYVWIQLGPQVHGYKIGVNPAFDQPPMGPAYEVSIDIRHLSLRIIGSHGVDGERIAKSISQVEGYESSMHQIWPPVSVHLDTPSLV
jgi:hypothetical protein